MHSRVVGATPTFQKFHITPMSVTWKNEHDSSITTPTYFKKLRFCPSASVLHNILRETVSAHIHAKYAAECDRPFISP